MTAHTLTLVTGLLAALAVGCAPARWAPAPPAARRWGAIGATPTSGPARVPVALVALLLGVGVLPFAPPLAVAVIATPWVRRRILCARARREHERAVARALPDVVDLLLLCTSAGTSLALAHPMVARRAPAPLGAVLLRAATAAHAGAPRADALVTALQALGESAGRLGHVLADHMRYGVPLAPGLERLGSELRLERQRRAEQDARRVPVRLLGPLLTCVLPAFALLTVVPLLAASLRALPT